jgi:hypothetical protein
VKESALEAAAVEKAPPGGFDPNSGGGSGCAGTENAVVGLEFLGAG